MTQKDIIAIAKNPVAMEILAEIAEIQANMCYKTIYERKTATRKMKDLAKEMIDEINWKSEVKELAKSIDKFNRN